MVLLPRHGDVEAVLGFDEVVVVVVAEVWVMITPLAPDGGTAAGSVTAWEMFLVTVAAPDVSPLPWTAESAMVVLFPNISPAVDTLEQALGVLVGGSAPIGLKDVVEIVK